MQTLPAPLAGLARYRQFMLYTTTPDPQTGKLKKTTVSGAGYNANAHDPANWMDAGTACAMAAMMGERYGVAFVLTENDPYFLLDLDNCALPDGSWTPLAQSLCDAFLGCCVEISTSGTGLHIIGSGVFPEHACKRKGQPLEFYTQERFIALTGTAAIGNVDATVSADLAAWLVASYFPPRVHGENGAPEDWTDVPVAEWRGPTDNADLLRRAGRAKSAASVFGASASFDDLWTANVDVLGRVFPSDKGDEFDRSSADLALASHLAFWTGKNCERMKLLMLQSGLVRSKWEREEYIEWTVMRACEGGDVCKDKPVEPVVLKRANDAASGPALSRTTARLTEGSTYLTPEQQIELFKGCVYVVSTNSIWVPGMGLMDQRSFKVMFGGYSYVLDRENGKVGFDPWEAFTNSRAVRNPVVHAEGFWPDDPPGFIRNINGEQHLNTYQDLQIEMRDGDVTPFLVHLAKLLPVERDRTIFLSYLAAIVQHKGVKFKWAPVLQGVQGNGKTFFSLAATHAVGSKYTHWPASHKLSAQFNSWMYRRILYCVEDLGKKNPEERFEVLKPMITGENLEIEGKGIDQESKAVCGNFIFNTNHMGAAKKTEDDRRYAPFYSAQQVFEDLERDGITAAYVTDLYAWAKGEGKYAQYGQNYGFSIIAKYLYDYKIPDEFNPATGCPRAPSTSSTAAAVRDSLGAVEQAILEAVADDRPGFRNGYVSARSLKLLLDEMRHSVLPSRRPEIMQTIGYVLHPGLNEGRTPRPVMPDAARTQLYVKAGTFAEHMRDSAEICNAYEFSQQDYCQPRK